MPNETPLPEPEESMAGIQGDAVEMSIAHDGECAECKRWAEAYEAATIAFFRLQNQFEIASLIGDSDALWSLAKEINRASARRTELKDGARKHRMAGTLELNASRTV
jgi:hypothetical protein